jgi:hypothetical protein
MSESLNTSERKRLTQSEMLNYIKDYINRNLTAARIVTEENGFPLELVSSDQGFKESSRLRYLSFYVDKIRGRMNFYLEKLNSDQYDNLRQDLNGYISQNAGEILDTIADRVANEFSTRESAERVRLCEDWTKEPFDDPFEFKIN